MAWQSSPSNALWYGEVVFENEEGETDYAYAYSASKDEPDPSLILPTNMRESIIEQSVKPTPKNESWVPSEDQE